MVRFPLHFRCIALLAVAITAVAGLLSTELVSAEPPGLRLAADGKAAMPVIISDQTSAKTRGIAEELARYLSRISGARFEVQTGDGKRGIVLGTLAEFPHPELARGLEIRNTFDGKEAYAIRTEKDRLLLIGATDLGASHAAFRWLESLGCRRFFPAPEWEVVPSQPTLVANLNETDRPALLARRIWWGYGFFDRKRCLEDYDTWARHNRMAASLRIWCGHAWQSIILANQKTFDQHPEYLALVKGQRQGPQFCISNPEVRRIATQWALLQFLRRPDLDMVSMETSDGSGHCECPECQKLGSISDRVFGLANEVARAVNREFPGRRVGMLAYNDHCEPPSFALEPNVYVQSTAGFVRGRYTFDELMDLWPKHCKNLGFYDYFSVWLWDFDRLPGGRGANVPYIRERIPRYVRQGATSVDCESGNNWGVHGRGYYVANRLMWNPNTDVDALLADFYAKAFAPAAAVMQRYYERLDPGNEPLLSEHLLALALRDLDEASKLAKDRPDVLARLDHLKQYQHYERLRWEFDRTQEKERKCDLALAAITHAYRTRFSYMNHWQAILQSWTTAAAKEFDRPTWSVRDRSTDKPWKVETPYTRAETEKCFQEDLQFFQPQPVEEKTFSADLVPGGFRTDAPAAGNQRYQGVVRYALWSDKGAPLEVTITTGVIAWYRDRAEAVCTITTASGKEIDQRKLPQDGKEHVLTVKVPAEGLYWLEFKDHGAGWGMKTSPGQPVALALPRSRRLLHLGQYQPMFFYVPKGQRTIQYFWDGGPHEVRGPDRKVIAQVKERGKFITVSVPEGADGRVWSFTRLPAGQLWFMNLPNYLAASPDAILVPRELAGK
jgi:hypothetical protein